MYGVNLGCLDDVADEEVAASPSRTSTVATIASLRQHTCPICERKRSRRVPPHRSAERPTPPDGTPMSFQPGRSASTAHRHESPRIRTAIDAATGDP